MDSIIWHYTIWLPEILSDGVIRLAYPHDNDNPRTRAVWFSRHQHWEGSVKKLQPALGRHLTFVEMTQMSGFGRIGITPEVAPVNWNEYQRVTGLRRAEARCLEKVAKQWGASPKDWFVSFEPVPRSQWLAIQVWEGLKWVDWMGESNQHARSGETAAVTEVADAV